VDSRCPKIAGEVLKFSKSITVSWTYNWICNIWRTIKWQLSTMSWSLKKISHLVTTSNTILVWFKQWRNYKHLQWQHLYGHIHSQWEHLYGHIWILTFCNFHSGFQDIHMKECTNNVNFLGMWTQKNPVFWWLDILVLWYCVNISGYKALNEKQWDKCEFQKMYGRTVDHQLLTWI